MPTSGWMVVAIVPRPLVVLGVYWKAASRVAIVPEASRTSTRTVVVPSSRTISSMVFAAARVSRSRTMRKAVSRGPLMRKR